MLRCLRSRRSAIGCRGLRSVLLRRVILIGYAPISSAPRLGNPRGSQCELCWIHIHSRFSKRTTMILSSSLQASSVLKVISKRVQLIARTALLSQTMMASQYHFVRWKVTWVIAARIFVMNGSSRSTISVITAMRSWRSGILVMMWVRSFRGR